MFSASAYFPRPFPPPQEALAPVLLRRMKEDVEELPQKEEVGLDGEGKGGDRIVGPGVGPAYPAYLPLFVRHGLHTSPEF